MWSKVGKPLKRTFGFTTEQEYYRAYDEILTASRLPLTIQHVKTENEVLLLQGVCFLKD